MTHTTNKKAAGAINTNRLHTHANIVDFRIAGAIEQARADGKAIANQIAALGLAGHTVHKGVDGDYLVCKYGLSRWCKDFAELQAFAKKLGVQ